MVWLPSASVRSTLASREFASSLPPVTLWPRSSRACANSRWMAYMASLSAWDVFAHWDSSPGSRTTYSVMVFPLDGLSFFHRDDVRDGPESTGAAHSSRHLSRAAHRRAARRPGDRGARPPRARVRLGRVGRPEGRLVRGGRRRGALDVGLPPAYGGVLRLGARRRVADPAPERCRPVRVERRQALPRGPRPAPRPDRRARRPV